MSTLPVWSCILCRPPVFLTGRAAPFLANDGKRFILYQQFWQLLKDLVLWDHPTCLARKGLVTHPSDRREIMPKCVQNVNNSAYLVEGELIITFPVFHTGNQKQISKPCGCSIHKLLVVIYGISYSACILLCIMLLINTYYQVVRYCDS